MVMGDESTTDSVRNQADNEFRIRYNGGIRLRVSTAANGNTPARAATSAATSPCRARAGPARRAAR
jgi:hypothetical protein